MEDNNNVIPNGTTSETTNTSVASTDYVIGDSASVASTADKAADTPIYTTSEPVQTNPVDNYSVPSSTIYTDTAATYSGNTYSSTTETTESKGLAIASLICGILSILLSCCCCGNILFSIGGIVCGILQKPMADGKKPDMAKIGIITSIVGIVLIIIISVISLFLRRAGLLDTYLTIDL